MSTSILLNLVFSSTAPLCFAENCTAFTNVMHFCCENGITKMLFDVGFYEKRDLLSLLSLLHFIHFSKSVKGAVGLIFVGRSAARDKMLNRSYQREQ